MSLHAGAALRRGIPLVLILLVGGVVWWKPWVPAPVTAVSLPCPDLVAGCSTRLGGETVRVRVEGGIKPLEPFQVWVEAAGVRKVEASFTMEGMDMGFNLYTLRAAGEGVFQARVTLPVCVTGRRDWIMNLDLDGSVLAVPFVTDL
ncbi:MAG: hypothetical protein AB1421_05660 [Pseudomonadota bacterium]